MILSSRWYILTFALNIWSLMCIYNKILARSNGAISFLTWNIKPSVNLQPVFGRQYLLSYSKYKTWCDLGWLVINTDFPTQNMQYNIYFQWILSLASHRYLFFNPNIKYIIYLQLILGRKYLFFHLKYKARRVNVTSILYSNYRYLFFYLIYETLYISTTSIGLSSY